MTMKIEVQIPEDDIKAGAAAQYLARAMSAIGYSRGVSLPLPKAAEAVEDMKAENLQAEQEAADAAEEQPVRERGKPAPGKARRTKEEIAEDEAADKADAEAAAAEEKPAISTGEERIDPASAEDQAQDAADEQAEVEQTTPAKLTHDDVRAALKKYLDAYGTAAAMEDGPKVLTLMFGEGKVKVSDVPEDQEALQKAIDGIGEMLRKNPFSREAQL